MPKVSDIMSTDVQVVGPRQTLQSAAQLMDRLNVGSLPVCDGRRLIGMITDRDITVRGTAAGLTPNGARVADVMSKTANWCLEDQDIEDVLGLMGEEQVRRLPVVDGHGRLVGIVSIGDLATRQHAHIDRVVREISMPAPADPARADGLRSLTGESHG
jgi:CBS domain-containing protein